MKSCADILCALKSDVINAKLRKAVRDKKILILLYFSIREIFTQKSMSYNKILLILVFCLSNANEYIYMMVMMMLLYVQ